MADHLSNRRSMWSFTEVGRAGEYDNEAGLGHVTGEMFTVRKAMDTQAWSPGETSGLE